MMKTDWKHIYSVLKENKQEMNYFLVCSMTEKSVQSGRNIQIKCVTQTELKLMRSFTSYVVPVRERSFRDIQMDTDLSLHLETAGWTRTNWRDYICHLVDGSLRRSWRCCWGEERVGEALKQKQKRSRLTKRCLLHFVNVMFTVNCWMFVRRRVSEALLNQDEVTLNTTVPMSLSCCCYGEDSVTSDFSSLTSSSVAASWLGLSDEFRVWWSVIPPVIIHVNIFIHPAHI